jgi:Protease inhibitor Inh
MIKVALGLLAVGIAAMPFVDKGATPEKTAVAYQEVAGEGAADPNQTVYSVTSQTGAACHITRKSDQTGKQAVKAESACADVYAGLERVTDWIEADDGEVALKDATGNMILRVGASDGFAYEALTANGAQITFALGEV